MAVKTRNELKAQIDAGIKVNGNREITPPIHNSIETNIIDSFPNLKDGGNKFESAVGYNAEFILSDRKNFASVGFVEDAIASGGLQAGAGLSSSGGFLNVNVGSPASTGLKIDGSNNVSLNLTGYTTSDDITITPNSFFIDSGGGLIGFYSDSSGAQMFGGAGSVDISSGSINIGTSFGSIMLNTISNVMSFQAFGGNIQMSSNVGGMTFTDGGDAGGIKYASNYSAFYTPRSLVDKAYVDGLVGSISSTLQGSYNASAQPQITTTAILGDLQIKRGSALDSDLVFSIVNGAGARTASFTGAGNLNASADIDSTHTFGRVRIGSPTSDGAYLSHFDNLGTTTYGFFQSALGATSLNAASGQSVTIRNANTTIATFSGTLATINTTIFQVNDLYVLDFDGVTYKKALSEGTATDVLFVGAGFSVTDIVSNHTEAANPSRIARFSGQTSAVNYFEFRNSATGVAPNIFLSGNDSNIALRFNTKGIQSGLSSYTFVCSTDSSGNSSALTVTNTVSGGGDSHILHYNGAPFSTTNRSIIRFGQHNSLAALACDTYIYGQSTNTTSGAEQTKFGIDVDAGGVRTVMFTIDGKAVEIGNTANATIGIGIAPGTSSKLNVRHDVGQPNIASFESSVAGTEARVFLINSGASSINNYSAIFLYQKDSAASNTPSSKILSRLSVTTAGSATGEFKIVVLNSGSVFDALVINGSLSSFFGQVNLQTSVLGNILLQFTSLTGGTTNPIVTFLQNRILTTDATVTTLHSFTTITDINYYIEVKVSARRTGGASGAVGDSGVMIGTVRVKNVGGVLTLMNTFVDNSSADQAWTIGWTTSGTNIILQVTGTASNNITWIMTEAKVFTAGG